MRGGVLLLAILGAMVLILAVDIVSGQRCNPPCGPHGMCYSIPDTARTMCTCKRCWTGTTCSTALTTRGCQSSTSSNARRVVVVSSISRSNPCDPNPCMYKGYCQVDEGTTQRFRCTCVNNRDGVVCHNPLPQPRNPCSEATARGVTLCRSGTCSAPPDIIGHTCPRNPPPDISVGGDDRPEMPDEDFPVIAPAIIDPCNPNPCQEGGACQVAQNRAHGFRCTCTNDRRGLRCDTPMRKPRNLCDRNPNICGEKTCRTHPRMIGHMCV